MNYVTVFEITQKPFQWWFPALGLFFVAIGIALIKIGRKWPSHKHSTLVGWGMIVFASLWTFATFYWTDLSYLSCLKAYRVGSYSVVEGQVQDFHPMPYEGHRTESFRVQGVTFCYSDYIIQPGFNQTASHGGPIREGLPVRIAYYNREILRLEIREDSLPSIAERSAYAAAQKARWKQEMAYDPRLDHMSLGLLFAALVIVLCWNLDWQHFMHYWILRDPPYHRFLELGFRTFFLANLVGCVYTLVKRILEKPRTQEDYKWAVLDSLIWIGFFAVADTFFRWRMSRRKKGASVDLPRPTGAT